LISCIIVILSKAKDLLFYQQLEVPQTPNKMRLTSDSGD
jgi:hypothetical protein